MTKGSKSNALSELVAENIYHGIDLRYYFEDNKLRFDFIVKPGSNPNQILLESSEDLDNIGNKLVSESWGLNDLYTYQNSKSNKIFSEFISEGNLIKFSVGIFDPTIPLIIDPLLYSSYIGGLDIDSGEDLVIDRDGSIIIVGETASPNFPTTLGSYQREISPSDEISSDIFVTKVDLNYNQIFTTYIGSSSEDFGRGVDVDRDGNIYVTGYTYESTNFPTTADAYDQTHNGQYDAFIIKLNPEGNTILKSTLIGGERDDYSLSIKVLDDESIAITGYTTQAPDSAAFPSTTDAFNEIYIGKIDGFATRINNDLDDIFWSGFLGGLNDDFPQDLAIGPDSTIYVAGLTRSENYPTTDGVLFREYNDNNLSSQHSDAFITQISNDGRSMLLSTVYGGSNGDIAYGMKVDREGNIYIAGESRSADLPTTENAPFREINRGNDQVFRPDAYVAKFNSTASQLLFASYLGGESTERAFDIGIDSDRNIYAVGTTSSQNFPITEFAYDKKLNDSIKYSDIFITKFNSSGDSLDYSTFFGADRSDLAKAVQIRSENRVVIAGNTSSTFLKTTNDAIQVSYQDSSKADAFFAEFFLDDFNDADILLCRGGSTTLNSEITSTTTTLFFAWSPEESLDDPTKEFPIASPEESTLYTCVVTTGDGEKLISQTLVAVLNSFQTNINGAIDVGNGEEYLYSTQSNASSNYSWKVTNGTIKSGQGTNSIIVVWDNAEFGNLQLIETNSFGCKDTATVFTNFLPQLPWDVYPFGDYVFCEGDTILLDAGPQYTDIVWQDGFSGRYDTVYATGQFSFSARRSNGSIYTSPVATVEFLERPRKPTIIFSDKSNQLVCISSAENYYWYKEEELIFGQNTRFLNPIGPGCYQVSIENLDSCINRSDDFCLETKNAPIEKIPDHSIYPNPNQGTFKVNLKSNSAVNNLQIINSIGRTIYCEKFSFEFDKDLNLDSYGRGVYYLLVDDTFIDKIIIY